MQQVLKDILSVKGLIMLIALVALGLSITAVVRGCGDDFGDGFKRGGNLYGGVDKDDKCQSIDFAADCEGMDPSIF